MENVMIVSSSDKGTAILSEILIPVLLCQITAAKSCGEARRILLERNFDLVIIDAPLRDETGEDFAIDIASKEIAQVILIVKREFFEAVSAICEVEGVLTIAKPLNKYILLSALSLARSVHSRMRKLHSENLQLKEKIEDIRIVDRAKCILISLMNMSEKEAHRHIEKRRWICVLLKGSLLKEYLKNLTICEKT